MPIRILKDGRTILDGADYTKFRKHVYWFQDQKCLECGIMTSLTAPIEDDLSFHISHRGSRGMGSGYRDDVLGQKKGQVEGGKCGRCHMEEDHRQKRGGKLHWSKHENPHRER